ncbi:MAG: lysostaphin resistance A-like protein [Longimicrobiales bacterium]
MESGKGGWARAIGRLLLFLAICGAFMLAGSIVVPPGMGTRRDLIAQSALFLGSAVLAGIVLLRGFEGRQAGALGFGLTRAAPGESLRGLVIGLIAIAVPVALLAVIGTVHFAADAGTGSEWVVAVTGDFTVLAVAAAGEEALFRGYPLQILARTFGGPPAVLGTSVAFALAHGANPNVDPIALVNIFFAGVMLAVAYLRTRSLWFATAVHVGWNWGMASLLDLPVSGLVFMDTPLYEPVVTGEAWLTGGGFGPEGGLAGTIGFAIALLAVVTLRAVREQEETRALRPIVDT